MAEFFDGAYTNTNPQTTVRPMLRTLVDDTDPDNVYVGKAPIGSQASRTVWNIKNIKVTDGITDVKYASFAFDKSWDDRASHTYL